MPAPVAAGAALGGGKVAGAGAAAGSTTSTGSAGAKAASKSAASRGAGGGGSMGQGGGGNDGDQGGGGGGGGGSFMPKRGGDGIPNSKLLTGMMAGGVFFFLVILIPMLMMGSAIGTCLATGAGISATGEGSLGGVKGTGVTREELKLIRSHIYAGNKITEGQYSATVYGQPWDALAGTPDTSTGLELGSPTKGKKKYIVAMDPQLNNYGAFVYIWPNPHNWTGPFVVADTGQDGSDGVDIWEWRGMNQMEQWGRKNVQVSSTPIKDPPTTDSSGSSESISTTGGAGYGYPLAETGQMGGGVAAHMARAFGNWMSDNAVDILVPNGTKVLAVGDGRIDRLSGSAPNPCANPAGYTVYMRSGGENFAYMHLNRVTVRPGQRVKKGDVIGLSGSANCVPHLHFAAEGMNPEDIVTGGSASGGFTLDVDLLKRKFGIPTDLPPIYVAASEKYKLGIRGPSILAAINRIETNFGELANDTSYAGAVGWMQFMPATWAAYGVDGDGDGEKDPTNKWDAIFAAANYLKASGAPGDWYGAIFAYNHADWYVQDVLAYAKKYFPYLQPGGLAAGSDCGGEGLATGPANIQEAVTLYEPRKWVPIPASIGDADEVIDARLLPAATWISKTYNLHITQGGWQPGSPSVSHGYGTALDMVPKGGKSWDDTALRLANDLGWSPDCASSGQKPACDLVPAIYNVYYNGFPNHGDPEHAGSGAAHIHIQFECACSGGGGASQNIATWVKTFPVSDEPDDDPPKADRPKKKKGNRS